MTSLIAPTTVEELAEVIATTKSPLAIQGGGTRGIAVSGSPLSTKNLQGISLYDPGSLTIVAQAGTQVDTIKDTLAQEGQSLAFEPMNHKGLMGTKGIATIGGVIASNISGPRRFQVGAARDFTLGVQVVDGQGRVFRNGGRVMKNVTGFDLVKLMTGSYGTLGVLTEVSLKILPLPKAQATILVQNIQPAAAVATMSKILGSPFEITGAAFSEAGPNDVPTAFIRIEGFEDQVRYRCEKISKLLSECDAQIVDDPERSAEMWRDICDVKVFHQYGGNVWRISVKPTDAPTVLNHINPDHYFLDWAGGLIWVCAPSDIDIRDTFPVPGHATLIRGKAFPRFQPEPAPLAKISAGIRAKFDPRGILNQGLMG